MSFDPKDIKTITPQDSLVAVMIFASAADETIDRSELKTIEETIHYLRLFKEYDPHRVQLVGSWVFELLNSSNGLEILFEIVREALPRTLYETAYALACDVAAADGKLPQAELRFLQEIRYELAIDRLHAAAIERGARARHMSLHRD